jgi:hypothetical protein
MSARYFEKENLMRAIHYALIAGTLFTTVVPMLHADTPAPAAEAIVPAKKKPLVQIAILLDTSGSMNGLIDQAKSQLWKVVNEFAKAQRDGQRPDVEVALYQYGTPGIGDNEIRQLVPLTSDLDKVSEELFKLKTDGGEEYCGAVIKSATDGLKWSDDKNAYKAIFIAGNEPFTQGKIDYKTACKDAIAKGIIINTIHCGTENDGINGKWKDGAALSDGSFMCIDQNAKVVHVAAPQDKEIAELSGKINGTYVAYGKDGKAGAGNQAAQDNNAATAPAPTAAIERAVTKANGAYKAADWDLVDAAKEKKVEVKDVPTEQLPDEMKKLDAAAREKYVADKQKERTELQEKILKLNGERNKYLAENAKKTDTKTLDSAIVDAVQTQAKKNGLSFETPAK